MPTAAAPEVNHPMAASETFLRMAQQFGLPLVMLGLILWWAKNDVMMPLLKAHFDVVDRIVTGQKEHTERLEEISGQLEKLIEIQK